MYILTGPLTLQFLTLVESTFKVNDHLWITNTCLQRPQFWGPNFNFHNIELPLNNYHLSTTATNFKPQGRSLYTSLTVCFVITVDKYIDIHNNIGHFVIGHFVIGHFVIGHFVISVCIQKSAKQCVYHNLQCLTNKAHDRKLVLSFAFKLTQICFNRLVWQSCD